MSQLIKPISAQSPSKLRSSVSQYTQLKSPYNNEIQQGSTQQKSQYSLRNSHYTSKFEKNQKLMNLVELQQHEINNWKRRYEQAEARGMSSYSAQTLKDYDNHLDQLTKELKSYIFINDDLNCKLKDKDNQISKLN
ncbi:unnamed protein product [Paramecium sonneborni]|uniref:Uncharacterized protein n=1 Tax=Paramecium sonneborni TaxID=65129 RepID=A0A8S1PD86_9CILI|nr:unnamed protein product [Paramecium sonneborni]CAD8101051.1 unnamed protein product [Paramecium sonneborni]